MTTHRTWYEDLTNHAPRTAAAEKAGLPQSTLHNQVSNSRLRAETVIALARAYGRNPVRALIETGFLAATEAGSHSPTLMLELISDKELIRETARRINADESAWEGTFDSVLAGEGDELKARRSAKSQAWFLGQNGTLWLRTGRREFRNIVGLTEAPAGVLYPERNGSTVTQSAAIDRSGGGLVEISDEVVHESWKAARGSLRPRNSETWADLFGGSHGSPTRATPAIRSVVDDEQPRRVADSSPDHPEESSEFDD